MQRTFRDDLFACLRFYSRLPVPAPRGHEMPDFRTAVRALPLAGAVIGACAAAALLAARALGLSPFLAAALAVGALILVTGALHEDGLADLFDGFGGGATREEKLEIMRDSRLGSYGAIGLTLSLMLRVGALSSVAERSVAQAAAVLVFTAALSRTTGLAPIMMLAPARGDGAGHAALRPFEQALRTAALLALALALLPLGAGTPLAGLLLAGGAAVGAAYATAKLAERQIGGLTGDVLGAAQQMAEVAALLAFAAH
ncbi:adenosylcobinamide-GDP ribazoletransferase [Methylosinus sp. Sm6]|nr:adenosylcobinamide-GDP ribazoletransferase [Methylosinus sp. Sm6]